MLLVGAGCRSLDVPTPKAEGSIQGSVVYLSPTGENVVAGGASIELLGTSVSTTADSTTGFFSLRPIPSGTGSLLIHYDADHDGHSDHDRSLSLAGLQAGPGRQTSLGEVVLSGVATIRGSVLRADVLASSTGHGNTSVFVPEGPYLVATGDNGSFTLPGLPEGDITVAVFRPGYLTQQTTLTLRAGQTTSLPTIILTQDATAVGSVRVSGSVTLFGQASSSGVEVSASTGEKTTSASDGTWSLDLAPGLYVFGFRKEGYGTVTLRNLAVVGSEYQVHPVILVSGSSTVPDLDGGRVSFDAGVPDAGGDGGADGGDDGGVDGGPDAGALDAGPVALIDPLPAFKVPNSAVMLVGTHSSGGTRPYIYHWTQTVGPTVAIPQNHTTMAATPTITTPSTYSTLGFTLTINDAFDAGSAPSAEVRLPVGNLPTPVITGTPTAPVYAGTLAVLDGSGSTDPSGILSYLWTISPAGVVTTGPATGPQLRITVPSTVAVPVVVSATLTVTNGVGISNSGSTQFTLTTATAPVWIADAGAGQAVNGGDTVTLAGSVFSPVAGSTFTYQWSPSSESGGTPWLLTNPAALSTTFVAPVIVGPNKLLEFTLTATSTSGLLPAQKSAPTFVNIIDRTPPTVLGTGITPGLRAGLFGTYLDFSEPLNPVSILQVGLSSGNVAERLLLNNGTRVVVVSNPLTPGTAYTLTQGVSDASPSQNPAVRTNYTFIAEQRISPAYESVDTTITDPKPGLVLRAGTTLNSVEALIFGRDGAFPLFLAAFDPTSCAAAPCPLATDTTAPKPMLDAALTFTHRGLRVGTTAYANVQPRNYVTGAPNVTFVRSGATWSVMPSPPGTLATDGTKLYSAFVESGLKLATFDPGTNAWDLANANVASTDAATWSSDTSSNPMPIATINPNQAPYTYVAGRTSKTTSVFSYQLTTPPSTWTKFGPWNNVVDLRIMAPGATALMMVSRADGSLTNEIYGAANNSVVVQPSGVSSFDMINRGGSQWHAVVINGTLLVRMLVSGAGAFTTVLGPGGVDSFNNSASCTAASPELATFNEKVGITWAEQCAGGPWRIYFRLLN